MELNKDRRMPKPKKLRTYFIGYLSVILAAILALIILLVILFIALLSNGIILPANYGEMKLLAAKDRIASSTEVTPDMIPDTCVYAVFTPQGEVLSGNMSAAEAATAWKVTQLDGGKQDKDKFFLSIPRKNQICIVRYTLTALFQSPALRRCLPPPNVFFYILFGTGFCLEVFLLASLFGKKLTFKMKSLHNATEKIKNRDLDFSMESSGVQEIDDILYSTEKMKEALKESLQRQWDLEQTRREQISALAHDIKTPVTIVRGNVDLLTETNQTEEQKEYTRYIKESTLQMEQYIKTLIEISKAETGYELRIEPINSKVFLDEIHSQIAALTTVKKLVLNHAADSLPPSFSADPILLQRAIMNIVSNAVEYSPEGSHIHFSAKAEQNSIQFCVVDDGDGFSPEDLKHAAAQFYMGDKSRTSKLHYGMGLFITNSIVKQHKGSLTIANSAVTGGGMVTIEIPIQK